jgi:HD-like signal output (HDOD) protein
VLPEVIRVIESRIRDLPTLPTVATRIFEVSNNPETTIEDLRKIIATDPVVSSRVLKLVNSAYFGYPQKIDSLSKAILILGFNNIRALAMSVSIMEMYHEPSGARRLSYAEVWKHAVGTAFCGRALALNALPRYAEQCFVAGLLHDIGIIIIDQCFPKDYSRVIKEAGDRGVPFHIAEQDILGYTHTEVCGFIAKKWLLPTTLAEAITGHHDPSLSTEHRKLALTTHTADVLARIRGFGDYGDNATFSMASIVPEARILFHVREDFPDTYLETIDFELREAARLVKISL